MLLVPAHEKSGIILHNSLTKEQMFISKEDIATNKKSVKMFLFESFSEDKELKDFSQKMLKIPSFDFDHEKSLIKSGFGKIF
jgi:hypothetical protein